MKNQPLLLFAHGAGAASSSDWMQQWAQRLDRHARVVAFDYPYMRRGLKRPDRQEKLVEAHRQALESARRSPNEPTLLAGKSMGGRVSCHVAVDDPLVRGIICFGYPLKSASGKLRDQVLLELRVPILFLQGNQDRLCPLDVLQAVRRQMRAPNELYVVDGGDHSLRVGKRKLAATGSTQGEVDAAAEQAVAGFIASL